MSDYEWLLSCPGQLKTQTTREHKIFGRLSLVAERGWVGGSQQERSDDAFTEMAPWSTIWSTALMQSDARWVIFELQWQVLCRCRCNAMPGSSTGWWEVQRVDSRANNRPPGTTINHQQPQQRLQKIRLERNKPWRTTLKMGREYTSTPTCLKYIFAWLNWKSKGNSHL